MGLLGSMDHMYIARGFSPISFCSLQKMGLVTSWQSMATENLAFNGWGKAYSALQTIV